MGVFELGVAAVVLVVVLTATRLTAVLPPALPISVATTALVLRRSTPGVTTTLLAPLAMVATPAQSSNRTRPTAAIALTPTARTRRTSAKIEARRLRSTLRATAARRKRGGRC